MNATETFQHYQVLRRDDGSLWELGRGAMGVTYKAFDVNLRCLVALKVINTAYLDHPVARQRFIREARAAAALRHRNIAHVYHLGMDAQSFFYAMEFIEGETLDALVRRTGPLPPAVVLRFALQTARALAAAGRQRLVHRDIKPTNLMILAEDEDGETHQTIKVIDFGLARSAVATDASTHLTMGGFVGTPQYASPEQLEEKNVDGRSDIYSLGATLWYLLAGRPPFTGTLTSLITQHLTKEPNWIQLEGIPASVRELLGRMLRKHPDDRPQSADELRREIEHCLRALPGGSVGGVDGTGSSSSGGSSFFGKPGSAPPGTSPAGAGQAGFGSGTGNSGSLAPVVGSLVGGRYQITRLVGEGSSGRVFQARDLRGGDQTVALKWLHPELLQNVDDHARLRANAAKVQSAPHPGLLRLLAFEGTPGASYLVTEWSGGLTLVDLLRSRGRLTVAEALALLRQAVGITDFARSKGLECLELHLHQIFVVPTGTAAGLAPLWSGEEATDLLARSPLTVDLRIDPLGTARDEGELATWGGDLTLMAGQPTTAAIRDRLSSVDGLVESSYLHCLARLFYELVEGTPLPLGYAGGVGAGHASMLPGLGEAGSVVLRRALSPNPGFATDTEWFEALARAVSVEANGGRMPVAGVLVADEGAGRVEPGGASTADAPLSVEQETAMPILKSTRLAPLKPILSRNSEKNLPKIDLRVTAGTLFGACLGLFLLAMLFWAGSKIANSRPETAVAVQSNAHVSATPQIITPESQAVAKQPEMTPTASGEESRWSTWLDDTVFSRSVANETVRIPYIAGFSSGMGVDEGGQQSSDENSSASHPEGIPPDKPAAGATLTAAEALVATIPTPSVDVNSKKTESETESRSHRHRHNPPVERNLWQRLFGIKPKPRSSR